MRCFIFLIFIFLVHDAFAQSSVGQQKQLVPVTYSIGGKAKHPLPRIQAKAAGAHTEIIAFGLPSLPKNFRGIVASEPKQRIRRGSLTESVELGIDDTYRQVSDSLFDKSKKMNAATFARQKEKFLHGANAYPFFRHQWITLGDINRQLEDGFSFRVKHFFKKPLSYEVDFLPAAFAFRFPVIDPWKCEEPVQKMFGLGKMRGYRISRIQVTLYKTTERLIKHKNFDIYFKQNQTTPDQEGVRKVIDYLKQNDFVIMKAEMQGAASIEGNKENNERLQRARGAVIQDVFRAYNENPVGEDTLVLLDNFGAFRELIRSSPFSWLDTLKNEEIQHRVNTNQNLLRKLEPYLQVQRRATLKLTLGKKISINDQLNQLTAALEKMMNTLARSKSVNPDVEANVMGAMDYLMDLYRKGNINDQRVEVIIKSSPNPQLLYALAGYYFIKQFDAMERKGDLARWRDFWKRHRVDYWLDQAERNAITLADQAADRLAKSKYIRMCVDFQTYRFRFVELGLIDPEVLCGNAYPAGGLFTSLMLHQYAFLYELSRSKKISCHPVADTPYKRDSVVKVDEVLAQIRKESEDPQKADFAPGRLMKRSYDPSPKSPYYELLKLFYIKGDRQVMESVAYADGGKPELNVFNLYHLLVFSVNAFDPFRNFFYDKEISLIEMDRLINQLKKSDENMCRPQMNELYMDYHLKALYYIQRYFEPGNDQLTRIAESSLKFVTDYYKDKAAYLTTAMAQHVVWQLNQFNELPGTKPGAWYGYDLLAAIASRRKLEGEELKLYAHYLKMYNPDFKLKPALPKLYSEEEMMRLWKVDFR